MNLTSEHDFTSFKSIMSQINQKRISQRGSDYMTDKEKLNAISLLCLSHIGDKHSLSEEIHKIISTKKRKIKMNKE